MIIKEADEKKPQVAILEALAARRDTSPQIRKQIEQQIRNILGGIKGENEAAYEINFHFGPSKNYAVIHDLRIECEGRVAQIDHLLIGRFLDMWICETKNFSEGIAINEQGECSRFYKNKPYGMASPFEQNRKHMMVMEALFKSGTVSLPKRLGISIKPNMYSVVLVSNSARISRPKVNLPDLDTLIKSDQFRSLVERINDSNDNPLTLVKLIGTETLEDFARAIAAKHKPIEINWAAKFGLPELKPGENPVNAVAGKATPPPIPASASVRDIPEVAAAGKKPKKKLICATCSAAVEFNVARFCWLNKSRFGENIYCRECQKAV